MRHLYATVIFLLLGSTVWAESIASEPLLAVPVDPCTADNPKCDEGYLLLAQGLSCADKKKDKCKDRLTYVCTNVDGGTEKKTRCAMTCIWQENECVEQLQ